MKTLTFVLSPLLFLTSWLWPKNSNIWLYGAWFGKDYRDNSKALFEYAIRNDLTSKYPIQHIWIYKDKKLGNFLRKKSLPCEYAYSLKGISLQLRAKVFITCVNSSDFIPFLLTPKNYFVQLWHGSPMKKIGMDSRVKNSLRFFIDKIRFKTIDRYSLIVSPAKTFDLLYASAFSASNKVIERAGYPRNDDLFISTNERASIRNSLNIPEDEILLVYMPTHRKEGADKNNSILKPEILKLQSFDEKLDEAKITIMVKPHFYEKHLLASIKDSKKVKIIYDLPVDLYRFLGATDGLITDYSSVFYDYELLKKPIFIYPFDIEDYLKNDRGMYFEFKNIYQSLNNCKKTESATELINVITDSNNYNSGCHNSKESHFNETVPSFSQKVLSLISSKVIHS